MTLLDKDDYAKLTEAVREININNLFARSVVEQKIDGWIFADEKDNPETCYIVHPYGMSLLLGNSTNVAFNDAFRIHALNTDRTRNRHEWMQAYPNEWHSVLWKTFEGAICKNSDNVTNIENGVVEVNTRVNFKFNREKFLSRKQVNTPAIEIVRTDSALFRQIKGSVIPSAFWKDEYDFLTNGFSLSLIYNGKLASTAFSSFWFDDQFELGIETQPEFRGKGLAEIVCSALIDHCLNQKLTPIWACRLENTGSYKLAIKLGFEPALTLPYYRLSN